LTPNEQNIRMETNDQRYLVQQNKLVDDGKAPPVFAKVMRSKEGKFEGVSFIRNKEKATVMTVAEAQEVVQWATQKKGNAKEYVTKVICVGQ
jgi:tRNA G18 (ribose-2'-O)-methylase SpoU